MAVLKTNDKGITVTVPAFSYSPNDSLAQLIVDAWLDDTFRNALLDRAADGITITDDAARTARTALAGRGFYLERAVVIKESEHDIMTIPCNAPTKSSSYCRTKTV